MEYTVSNFELNFVNNFTSSITDDQDFLNNLSLPSFNGSINSEEDDYNIDNYHRNSHFPKQVNDNRKNSIKQKKGCLILFKINCVCFYIN